jgi:ferredoxin
VLSGGRARQGQRRERVLHRRRAQPRARRAGRARRRDPVQRLLLDVQGGAEPPAHRVARARGDQRAPRHRGAPLQRLEQGRALRRVARRRDRHRARGLQGRQAAVGHAHRRALRLPPAAPPARRALGRPAAPHQGRGAHHRARRARGRLPHQDAVLRRRARPRRGARLLARVRAAQARRRAARGGRRARRGLPELLPAVRPQPGRAPARQRGHPRARPLPRRAHRAHLRPRARGDRPGMHRVSVDPFLERWGSRTADKVQLAEHFDVALLGKCYSCQACKDDCPVCKVDTSFQPTEIIGDLVRGHLDDVVADSQLWKCLECYTCQELCHSDIGMATRSAAQGARDGGGQRAGVGRRGLQDVPRDRHARQAQGVRAQEARPRAAARHRR